MWEVVTETGTQVFQGSKRQCKDYLKQALEKGSKPGFLTMVKCGIQKMRKDRSMYEKNIYKAARQKAGKTQEAAAEALGISVESIKAYESYSRLPPSNIVDGMCIIYDAIYLAYQHNRIVSGEIKVIPEVEVLDLPRATLRLINLVLDFAEKRQDRTLMQIAEDGVIDEEERPAFEAITAFLDELIKAAMEVKLARQGEE